MFTKILALILSVCMLITSAPFGGVAEELGDIIASITKNSADSVDGSVESLGQVAEDGDFVVKEDVESEPWDGTTTKTPTVTNAQATAYDITSGAELAWVAYQLNRGALNFSGVTLTLKNDIDLGGHNWTPIGSSTTNAFKGTLDGNGHTIKGLNVETATELYAGLFGCTDEATIKNLGIIEPTVTQTVSSSDSFAGAAALVEYAYQTTITGCYVKGGTVSSSGTYNAGGLVGVASGTTKISDCYVLGTEVYNGYDSFTKTVGGVVSHLNSTGVTVSNCYSTAVCKRDDTQSSDFVGAIVGDLGAGTITNCYGASDIPDNEADSIKGSAAETTDTTNMLTLAEMKSADFVTTLGEGYVADTININDGYPMLAWEFTDTEAGLRTKYNEVNASEYITNSKYSETCPTEYQALTDKLEEVNTLLTDDVMMLAEEAVAKTEELNAAFSALKLAFKVATNQDVPWDGSSATEPHNDGTVYEIYNGAELAWISQQVAAGDTFEGKTVLLMNDIDLGGKNEDGTNNTACNFMPIGGRTSATASTTANSFKGTFDGQYNEIRGLYINSAVAYTGLFGYATEGAVIRNFGLISPVVTGKDGDSNMGVAAVVGRAVGVTIDNVFVRTPKISGDYRVGGIVGYTVTTASTITNCYVQGGTIASTKSTSSGTGQSAGGIIGCSNVSTSKIENCYSTATLTEKNSSSTVLVGMVGRVGGNNIQILNSYIETYALYGSGGGTITTTGSGTKLAAGTIKTYASKLGAAFVPDSVNGNAGYPRLRWEDPVSELRVLYDAETASERMDEVSAGRIIAVFPELYAEYKTAYDAAPAIIAKGQSATDLEVAEAIETLNDAIENLYNAYNYSELVVIPWDGTTKEPKIEGDNYYIYRAEELAWLSENAAAGTADANKLTGKTVYLMKDIDLAGSIAEDGTVTNNWTPIGGRTAANAASTSYVFAGTFEGQGHVVKNMVISEAIADINVGLFGCAPASAVINELGVVNATVKTTAQIDATNCGVAALIGYANGSTIKNCFVRDSSITTTKSHYTAGLVGTANSGAVKISNCYVQNVTVDSQWATSASYAPAVGGIIAYTYSTSAYIKNCYSAAKILSANTANKFYGNIGGYLRSAHTVEKCFAVSGIEGNEATALVGASSAAGSINSSNATGRFDTAENFKSAEFPAEIGEAFSVDVINTEGNYLNDGYPILYWEDPEFNLRKLYNYELASERKLHEDRIKSVFADLYKDYQDALDEAERIVSTLTSDPVAEIDAAFEDLQNKIEALYNAYYKSEDVVLPWNGTNTINGVAVAEDATAEPKETDTDGAILIYRAEELAYIASQVNAANTYSGKVIRLAKDINLNGLEGDNKLWTPIGGNTGAVNGFAGTFDGNCKEISDLYINSTDKYAVGLFGYVLKGTIKNVHMINPNVKVVRTTAGSGTDDNGVGALIGALAGTTVEHCFVRGGSVESTYRAGGLIGSAVTNVSTVTNCYVQGTTVYTTDDLDTNSVYSVAGGIVGLANLANNTFNNCYSTAIMKSENTGGDYTGGIIGRSAKATIVNNCYVENDNDIYGLSGTIPTVNYPSAVVADGKIKTLASALGAEYVYDTNKNNGYPIFTCEGTDRDIIRDAYLTEMDSEREAYKDDIRNACPNEYSAYESVLAEAKAMVEATEAATPEAQQALADRLTAAAEALKDAYDVSPFIIITWDGNTIKEPIIDGTNYYIYTAEQLAWFSYQVAKTAGTAYSGATFHLMKNIDLGGVIGDANGEHTVVPTNAWTPIGGRTLEGVANNNIFFAGTFEGHGHIVKNMYIYETAATINVGLFGCTPAATIINELGIENAHVESVGKTVDTNYATGALVGYTNASTITNCFVRNSLVTATQTRYMGGLVGTGHTAAPKISNCYVSHTTIENKCAENQNYGPCVGGIIGYTYAAAVSIKNCYVAATLKNANTAGRFTGNIVGCMRSTFTNQVTTTQCYAANDIEGNQATALVGNSTDTIGMYPTSTFITQTAVDALGTAFAMDVNPAINNNFPILYWEDPEYNLRTLYNAELASERSTDEDLIAYITELYPELVAQYATAMAAAKAIVVDNPMVDNATAITSAYETLLAIKTELYETYYYSEEAILPWNGTHQVDGVDAVPKTDESGHYLIYRAEELAFVASYVNTAEANNLSGKTVKLMKDIDLNELEWTPIGGRLSDGTQSADRYFRGNFDGQHHKIYGLKIDTDKYQTGLFGYIEGTSSVRPQIKNVGIIEPNLKVEEDVIGNNALAPLAGHTNYTDIQHCFVRGGRVECNTQVGGLVGRAPNSTFKNCYVEGTEVILSITQEMATGLGSTTYPRAGGIVGYPQQTSTYTNVYSTAVVTAPNVGDSYTAGIIGMCHSSGITLNNCYTVGETLILPTNTSAPTVTNSAVLDAETMKMYATVLGTEFTFDHTTDARNGAINNGYPIFVCEEKETTLVDFYYNQADTEHAKYADIIAEACPEEWAEYQEAMNAILTLLDDNRVSDEAEINAAIDNLNRVVDEVLYPAYHKSEDVVLPWNGTVMEPKYVSEDGNDYYIYRAEELAWIAQNVNAGTAATNTMAGKNVHLMKDINLADREWKPIGGNGSTYFFRGHFDGHHHKVTGLKITAITVAGAGLFGYVYGASATDRASIKNLGVIDPEITLTLGTRSNQGVGAIVGSFYNADMDHCFVSGGTISSTYRTAALIGATITGTQNVTNCYVVGTEVKSTYTSTSYDNASAGALSAYNNAGPTKFENCYVADVTLTSGKGAKYVSIASNSTTENAVFIKNTYHTTDYSFNGTQNAAHSLDLFSGKVTTDELKTMVPVLGSEYVYALSDAAEHNYGYPVFWCEYPEARVKALVESEAVSERTEHETIIVNGLGADNEAYVEYKAALKAAQDMISDDVVATNDEQTAVIDRLTAAITAYEDAYNKSKAVVLPWNGEIKVPLGEVIDGVTTFNIYRADELAYVAAYVNAGYGLSGVTIRLMKDINLADLEWKPIGSLNGQAFQGTFDGQHNKIHGLKITQVSATPGYALFGAIDGATLKNFGVIEPEISISGNSLENYGTAAVVGRATGTAPTISHVFVREPQITADYRVGGIVGMAYKAANMVIENCYVQGGTLTSANASTDINEAVGGIIGSFSFNAAGTGTITNSYSTATLVHNNTANNPAGGIAGRVDRLATTYVVTLTINNSFAVNYPVYGEMSAAVTVNYPSRVVEANTLKTYAAQLGSEYTYDLDTNINNGYPIFWCEDAEATVRRLYYTELDSERATYADMIQKGVASDIYNAYESAMAKAKALVEDDKIASDEELASVAAELTAAKEALYDAYNASKAVVIPWTGERLLPKTDADGNYLIYRAEELAYVAYHVNSGYNLSGANLKIMKDIDLNGDEHNWIPIGARDVTGTTYDSTKYFSGNIDGQGNIVRNMSAESDISLIGLFGYINGATIKNIGIEDSTVVEKVATSSNNGSAILVGGAAGSTIEACFVRDCTVSGTNGPIAALVGLTAIAASTITDCYAQNVVLENESANKPASGIVGLNVIAGTTITNCYSNATATAASGLEAGILGNATAATTILNSYSANEELYASAAATAPTVSGGSAQVEAEALKGYSTTLGANFGDDFNGEASINAGYPILYWEDPEFEFRKYYAFELSSPRTTREDLMTKYTEEYAEYLAAMDIAEENANDTKVLTAAEAQVILENLKAAVANLREAYDKDLTVTVPWDGTAVEPDDFDGTTYKIYSAEELAWVSQYVATAADVTHKLIDKTVELQKDIDLAEINWTPIGGRDANGAYDANYHFRGTFDGQHKKIYGLFIDTTLTQNGLFGYVGNSGIIKNIGLINPSVNSTDITSNHGTGTLVGSLNGGTVQHAFVRGGTVKGRRAGGVVGSIISTASTVQNVYSQGVTITCIPAAETATTTGVNGSAGGVVGYNNVASSKISNCYSASTTAVTGSKTVKAAILGLSTQNMTLTNCFGVNDSGIAETKLSNAVSGKTVTAKTSGLYPAATIKANGPTIGTEFENDYLEINAGFPIFWCENVFQELNDKIDEANAVNATTITNYAAILKYQPELVDNLNNAIEAANNYLGNNPDVANMPTHIAALETAIKAIKDADEYYKNNTGALEALNITVFAPPILTLTSDGTYATGQTVRVKSNYLITGALTLTGGNNAGMNNVTLTPVEGYDTEGEGDETLYVYTFEIAGGTPEAAEEGAEQNTTVTFNATASSNGLDATASATSTFLTGVGSKTFDVRIAGQYNREDWWGSVETKTYLKNHYAIVGLHGYTDPEKTSYYKDYGTDDGEGSSKTYGSQSSPTAVGATGYFYHDKNNSNKLGVASGSTKTSSVGIAFIPEADGSYQRVEQSKLTADLTNYMTEKLVITHAAKETQYVYNKDVDSGQDDTITYTMYFMVEANDESTNTIHNYSNFTVDIIQVDTTALWNLYNYETNKINKTNRFEYKELYQQANPEAWAAYEAAYLNAAQVLQGGVPQETIDAAFEQFLAAVLGLGTLIKYDLNGGEGTIPEPHNVPIYRDVTVSSSEVVEPTYYLNDVYATDLAPYDGITRTGYQCMGWSLKKNATENDMVSGYLTLPNGAMSKAVTLYAAWNPNTYTIKYDGNKPANLEAMLTGVPTDQTATYDVPMNLTEATPQLTNHKFLGWNTQADGKGDMYEKGAEVVNLTAVQNGTVTLYAQWAPATSKTVFLLNLPEGAVLTENSKLKEDTEADLTIGTNVDLSDYALEASGWRHIGWATQAVATTPQYTDTFNVPQTATNLYAIWQKKAMTVFYNANFGELKDGEYTQPNESVNCGDAVKLPTAEEVYKAGYTLGGWKSSIDGQFYQESYIIPDSTVTEVTFTAEWFKRQTTITLHHNNSATEDVTTEIKGEYESVLDHALFITPEKTPDMAGYTFVGWFELTENGYAEYVKPSAFPADDIDLYAGWSMDALSEQLERYPSDINGSVEVDGETVYYYQEPGKTNAINEKAEADAIYGNGESGGKLYNWELIDDVNTATSELKTAIDALIETPADYTVVDQYRTYYYEMTLNDPNDEYNDTHTFNYNGVDYEVTKDTFTEDSFEAFEDAVEAVVNGKGIKNQADVDGYANALIEAYNGLTPKGADYTQFDWYLNEALILNTIIGSEDTSLEEFFGDTWGLLWYEEGTWYAFFEYAMIYNNDLSRDLSILEQEIVDSAVADLQAYYEGLVLNPADYTVYDENGYAAISENINNSDKTYQDAYRTEVFNLWQEIDNTRGQYSLRYDQPIVDKMIQDLADLIANPQYKSYELVFMLNDGTDKDAGRVTVECVASIKGLAPADPERDGYVFLGWYTTPEDTEDETGYRINFETTEETMGTDDRTLYARWEKERAAYTLDVSTTYSNVYVAFDNAAESLQGNKYTNNEVLYGTKVTLRAVPEGENREFMYWKDVGNKGTRNRIVSYEETLTFTLEADWYLVAVYSEAEGEGYYSVTFVDSILKTVISEQRVKAGEAAIAPEIAETHGEYTFTEWNTTFDNVTENMIITSVYVLSSELFTITTNINGKETKQTYRYNSPVTVTIADEDIPDKMVFAGWTVNGKDIVSYDKTYKFYAYKDMTVTAIFAEEAVEEEATVTLDVTTKADVPSDGKDTYKAEFMVTRDVPDDYVFVSSGLLLTQDENLANEDDLTFEGQTAPENDGKIRLYRTVHTDRNGQYQLTVRTYTDRVFYARGYVVYINGDGELVTLYTEVVKAQAANDENTTSN